MRTNENAAVATGGAIEEDQERHDLPSDTTPAPATPSTLAAALAYAGTGLPVFPCHSVINDGCSCGRVDCQSAAKHPRTEHGLHDATTDEAIIRGWFDRWPDANIAIATGKSSGLLVLDIDAAHGGDESLRDLEDEQGPLPDTPESLTGQGRHLLFPYPDSVRITNKAGIRPGLDLRGDGGYILAPPSQHITGRSYTWEASHALGDVPLAPVPDWLLALARNGASPAPKAGASPQLLQGHRNSELTRLAGAMRRHGATEAGILAALGIENGSRCTPPLSDGELRRITGSIARYEAANLQDASSPVVSMPLGPFLEAGPGRRADVVVPVATSGITFLGGGPGQGKTMLGLEILMTKASGISRIGFTAEAGPVLFVGADMGAEDTRDYLQMLMFEGRELALENLHIAITPGLLLDEPEGAEALHALIQEVRAELVVLDHFGCFVGSDGFTNRELRPILDCLRGIRDIDRVPLLILDLTRKQSTGPNTGQAPAIDALYGGRAKGAIADRVVFIKKDVASGAFVIKGAKERGAGFADLSLSFDAEGGWERLDSLPQHLTPAEASVAAVIAASVNLNGRTLAEIVEETGLSKRTVQSALTRLIYYGQIAYGPTRGRAKTYKGALCRRVQTRVHLH